MEKRLSQALILLALMFVAAMVYIIGMPAKPQAEFARNAAAEDTTAFNEYARGQVTAVAEEEEREFGSSVSLFQRLVVTTESGQEVQTEHTELLDAAASVRFKVGDKVVLGVIQQEGFTDYVVVDRYRVPQLWVVVGSFLILAVMLGKWRGLTALIGLGVTGLILIYFIAPQILAGKDPLLVSFVGAGVITLSTLFIAHGFAQRIRLAAMSMLLTLILASGAAWLAVHFTKLFGLGEENAFLLQSGFLGAINLRGILLGGIIISVLGVLDDITTSQTAAIDELYQTDSALTLRQLYGRGISIGREHIASLINTLILVYAGASLPLFLLFTIGSNQPVWVLFNSEYLAEELVRAVVGSIALMVAVPVSTLLSAWFYKNLPQKIHK